MKNTEKQDHTRFAECRSCGCLGEFTFAGTQHIPEHVAKKMNMDIDHFTLWNCPNCGTTLSDMNLK
jgi:Fe2+ or Zn2+ uptake regulation protein